MMTFKHDLLAGVSMTAAERGQGRYMRAPDHSEGGASVVETPVADTAPSEPPAPVSFDDAFAAAASDAPTGPTDPAAPSGPTGPGDPSAPTEPTAPTGPAGPSEPSAPAGPTETTPTGPAAPSAADDVLQRLAGLIQNPPAAQPSGPTPAVPAAPVAEEPPLYTPAETSVLEEFEKNWPDVAAAGKLERRGEYRDILKYVFTEVAKYVAPLQDQLRNVGNTLHTGQLKELVPDYSENLEQDVATWIGEQPAYLQEPFKQVMKNGTSDEVADLIGRYRTATGTVAAPPSAPAAPAAAAPSAAPTPAPKPAAKTTELSQAAKQAAVALAPVSSDRSHVPQGEDTGDFDSAFAKYATMAG